MNVAEKTAVQTLSNILGKLRRIIPPRVMGILIVMAMLMASMIMDLRIGLEITLSIVVVLISMYGLQPVRIPVFPSFLFKLALKDRS